MRRPQRDGHARASRRGLGADITRLASKSFRRPFGIAPVRTGHVVGQRAVETEETQQ